MMPKLLSAVIQAGPQSEASQLECYPSIRALAAAYVHTRDVVLLGLLASAALWDIGVAFPLVLCRGNPLVNILTLVACSLICLSARARYSCCSPVPGAKGRQTIPDTLAPASSEELFAELTRQAWVDTACALIISA